MAAAWMAGTRPAMTALPTFNPGPTANAISALHLFAKIPNTCYMF